MPDDWMRKYLVIAGQAPVAAELPKKEEPVVIPAPQEPPPAAEIKPEKPVRKRIKNEFNEAAEQAEPAPGEDKPKKKTPAKRSIKKEFKDAAEKKPKKAAPKRKPMRKAKLA